MLKKSEEYFFALNFEDAVKENDKIDLSGDN